MSATQRWHAILRDAEAALPHLEPRRSRPLHALIERSLLTALWALEGHDPAALDRVAADLLSSWRPGEWPGSRA